MPDPPPETASSQPQQIDVSNSDTISLPSSLLDAKLQKTFGDFKRSLDECGVETRRELKKLKTNSKAASSLQFKGNGVQFEFNTKLLDYLDLAISNLSEGNLLGVQEHLQKPVERPQRQPYHRLIWQMFLQDWAQISTLILILTWVTFLLILALLNILKALVKLC